MEQPADLRQTHYSSSSSSSYSSDNSSCSESKSNVPSLIDAHSSSENASGRLIGFADANAERASTTFPLTPPRPSRR